MLVQMNNSAVFFKYRFKAFSYVKILFFIACAVSCQLLAAQANGSKLSPGQVSTKNTGKKANANVIHVKKGSSVKNTTEPTDQDDADAVSKKTPVKLAAATAAQQPTYEEVKNLLQKNTCLACHNPDTRQVGPAYKDVAKRKYTVEQIVGLIHNPKPEHWPDYSTPMPPMAQVPNEEARKIAEWIKSLEKVK